VGWNLLWRYRMYMYGFIYTPPVEHMTLVDVVTTFPSPLLPPTPHPHITQTRYSSLLYHIRSFDMIAIYLSYKPNRGGGSTDPAWIPPWGGRCPGASHLTFVFRFWIHFWPIENAPKIHPPKRHPKISNFRPCGAQASFLHPFREPFWDSFLMNTLKS